MTKHKQPKLRVMSKADHINLRRILDNLKPDEIERCMVVVADELRASGISEGYRLAIQNLEPHQQTHVHKDASADYKRGFKFAIESLKNLL